MTGPAVRAALKLLQHRVMEFFPIIKIVQIHGVFEGVSVIRNATGTENRFSRPIIVIISTNRGVELLNRAAVELGAVFLHPRLKLRVGRFGVLDEGQNCIPLETQTVNYHLIKALAGPRISGSEFAGCFERGFKPEPWQMQNTERTRYSGTDERYNSIHIFGKRFIGLKI